MASARRPSARWFWFAGGLAILGVIGAVAWGFLTYSSLENRLEALPRTAVPGQVAVQVDQPQGMTIFYEDPQASGTFIVQASRGESRTLADAPVTVTVTGPSGSVPTAVYENDLRFHVSGRVATALATFDAPVAGTYTVRVAGDVPAGSRVSVGDVVDAGLIASFVGAVVLFVATLAAAAITVLVVAIRRLRQPTPVDETAPPLAHV